MTHLTDELRHMKEVGKLYYIIADAIDQAIIDPRREEYMNQAINYVKENCPVICWIAFEHTASSVIMINELEKGLRELDSQMANKTNGDEE